jgi:hypothetical protein
MNRPPFSKGDADLMSNAGSSSSSSGIGFLGALAILFIALKLTGCIEWSWWLVLAPIWGPLVLVLLFGCALVLPTLVRRRTK